MPVTMYQSFTFFNLTNWNQVKGFGQKPRFAEVGPYVYKTIWTKSDINFLDNERYVNFAERKQWIFIPHLSKGYEDDQIWTINTPLMTALALIQNAPVITRNIVSVILDGLGEGAFIKRSIRSLLFEGYSDLIVSVGPLFDRRFSNFNGKFAYLYNKNDSIDGVWTVSTGVDDMSKLNKISKFSSNVVNMTSSSSGQLPQGLNEVRPECASAWSLDQSTNGQLFPPFNLEDLKPILERQHSSQLYHQQKRRFQGRSTGNSHHQQKQGDNFRDAKSINYDDNSSQSQATGTNQNANEQQQQQQSTDQSTSDLGKYIFYPDLCRPIHLLPSLNQVFTPNGIKASRYVIDPKVFMNSSQVPSNRCYEMNPRPPLANTLAATINSVTGGAANVGVVGFANSGLGQSISNFNNNNNHHHHHGNNDVQGRSNSNNNNNLNAVNFNGNSNSNNNNNGMMDQQTSPSSNTISRLGRVRQLFSNIVSQRMAGSGSSLLPTLAGSASSLISNPFSALSARNSPDIETPFAHSSSSHSMMPSPLAALSQSANNLVAQGSSLLPSTVSTSSDRWITQFRFKWPKGVFSLSQCQLGAPIYASLPHFLDADDYYLDQVDGLKPNRSLHEFYIDVESTLHSVPVAAKARLQLNVATPELRFRNLPNAMIPVLWQEVTFDIDKPVASMLYWSMTLSPTIYSVSSLLLLIIGIMSTLISLAKCLPGATNQNEQTGTLNDETSEHHESQPQSWLSNLGKEKKASKSSSLQSSAISDNNNIFSSVTTNHLNRHGSSSTLSSNNQLASQTDSNCELVSSGNGAIITCAGCIKVCQNSLLKPVASNRHNNNLKTSETIQ